MRDGAVEEEVQDMQEVRCLNPCKSGEMRWLFVSSPITFVVKLHNITAFHRKIIYEFSSETKQLSTAYLTYFSAFSSTRERE